MSDIFDQLAASNTPQQTATPSAQQAPSQNAQNGPQGAPQSGGDIFDRLASQNAVQGQSGQTNQSALSLPSVRATPGSMPGDSLPSKITLWAQNLRNDLMHGTETTDIGRLYKSIGGQPLANGQGEGVGEFMGSPILGPTRVVQGVSELPQSGRRWQGTKDVVGGALDTATIPGGFMAPEAGEFVGTGTDAALTQAGRAARAVANAPTAIKNGVSVKALQPKLQDAIASAIHDAAAEHGVTVPDGTNLRDVTQALSNALREKAHGLYQQLDNALGGTRFQSFGEVIENIQQAIRDEVGLDPELDKLLSQRLADAKAARDAAIEQVQLKGVDPATIDHADSLHRQAMALQDVSRAVRASTDVHPSQMASGADNVSSTQVRMKPLFTRLQQLATPNPKYPGSPSRLVQALGEERAAQLLHDVDAAHLAAQKIVARNAWIKRGASALGLIGAGAAGYHLAHDLLGGQ